jgi:hypothetical protein
LDVGGGVAIAARDGGLEFEFAKEEGVCNMLSDSVEIFRTINVCFVVMEAGLWTEARMDVA